MPEPKNRSGSVRKKKVRVPSGESRERYERRKSGKKASCAICRAKLQGVQRSGPKSARRPERKFGGVLCPKCQAEVVKEAGRVKDGFKSIEDVAIIYRRYVEGILK